MIESIILMVVMVVGLILAGYQVYQTLGRSFELGSWAGEHDFTFQWGRYANWADQFPQFRCLQRGDHRYAHNIIEGLYGGVSFTAFDYHYETYRYVEEGSRGHRRRRKEPVHHFFSGAILRSPSPLKPLFIQPTIGIFRDLSSLLGLGGIEFESMAFNQNFAVYSQDRRWAYDVLHQAALEYLLIQPRFNLDLQTHFVMVYRDETIPPDEFLKGMDVMLGLLNLIPADVLTDHALQTP